MNERERIELLMKCYNLTPSQFADRTGIQRASVSHIISGRNKPSLEVFQKIYETFPELDIKWLITGQGEQPVASAAREENDVPALQNTLFAQPQPQPQAQHSPVQPARTTAVENEDARYSKPQPLQRPQAERQPKRNAPQRAQQQAAANERRIKEIRIFYTDGTYETMFPEK